MLIHHYKPRGAGGVMPGAGSLAGRLAAPEGLVAGGEIVGNVAETRFHAEEQVFAAEFDVGGFGGGLGPRVATRERHMPARRARLHP